MNNIYLKKITREDNNFYNYYKMAVLWDKKRECFTSKNDEDLFGLFERVYLMYLDDEVIGYGILFFFPEYGKPITKYYLTYIIKPECRKKGFGKILIHMLEETAKVDLLADVLMVEILKKNIPSISLIESLDYEFDHFDKKKIVFKKVLK